MGGEPGSGVTPAWDGPGRRGSDGAARPERDGAWRRERLAASRLYLCTPIRPDLAGFADAVLGAGVDLIQLRDKQA